MLLNTWSLALSLGSLLVVFLLAVAAVSAVRVLRHWNPASDEERQISLESEIWLSSTLVAYALAIQIVSLVLLVLAADEFAGVITGAMCATGTLQANEFGVPSLLFKLAGVFFYGFWLVIHRLDVSSEHYPLVRVKCWYLLALLPLVAVDIALQSRYLLQLDPDVIVSCCAVLFNAGAGGTQFFNDLAGDRLLPWFYGSIIFLLLLAGGLLWRFRSPLLVLYGVSWLFFLPLAMLTIITVTSSYIYAMPFHNCPFCILKEEYAYVGFAIYGTLLPAAFFALAAPLAGLFSFRFAAGGNTVVIPRFQRLAVRASLLLLLLFTLLSSFHYLRYLVMGGEV